MIHENMHDKITNHIVNAHKHMRLRFEARNYHFRLQQAPKALIAADLKGSRINISKYRIMQLLG